MAAWSILSDYLRQRVDTEQTRLWMAEHGPDGSEASGVTEDAFIYDGPSGERVLGVHKDITIGDVKWGVIAEISEAKAFAHSSAGELDEALELY